MRPRAVLPAALSALGPAAVLACTGVAGLERNPEQRALSQDGVPLAYEERGSGAPALVFVHGWCGERGLWSATMDALAPTHRTLALDLGGHGSSGAGRTRWTLAALAEDVVAVVRASGAEDVILIGHSMGAPVALLAAPELAPNVRGVIAVDGLHDADFAYPPGFLAGVAAGLEADFPRALEASFRGVTGPGASPEVVDWLVARALRTDRGAALALLRGLEGFDLAGALRGAGVPVRVVNAVPPPGAELVTDVERNRELADFDALLVEGSGHFPMLEQPARFRTLLARWIEELSASPASSAR
jgi:pimeloyl-ACP methyl ester carboxylesterase